MTKTESIIKCVQSVFTDATLANELRTLFQGKANRDNLREAFDLGKRMLSETNGGPTTEKPSAESVCQAVLQLDFEAYRERIGRAVSEAGLTPLHCVYDRKEYRDNECYIDHAGVTVSMSPQLGYARSNGDQPFQIRTCYRPKQGKGKLEKRLEAMDGAILDGMEIAVKDFEKFLNQPGQGGIINERYTGESWTIVK
jgi:hypothetical protein